MERSSKTITTRGNKRLKTSINCNNNVYSTEKCNVRTKNTNKTKNKKINPVQLHHFANLTKSTTATKVGGKLNLTGETKALLENDYFQLVNAKKPEFVANPFIINSDGVSTERTICNTDNKTIKNNYCKKEFQRLVQKQFKGKKRISKNPFAVACRDINSMINIKDYKGVFCKKIFETRLIINGILVYDKIKKRYSGLNVSRNCIKKKFTTKLNKATKELFPEMETHKVTSETRENRLLQHVIEYYDKQEHEINSFNEQLQIPNDEKADANLILECEDDMMERPVTPVNEIFPPESYETPPSQRLITIDLCASTVSKYQTVFYEKDAQSGKASLFEIPECFEVSRTNANNINRSVLKRIDFTNDNIGGGGGGATVSKMKGRVETARLIASGKLQINDLELIGDRPESPTAMQLLKCPKKRLFHNYSVGDEENDDRDDFNLLEYPDSDENVFVRPMYSPKEFTEYKKKIHAIFPSREPKKYLKVDELELPGVALKMKTPEHRYYPFVQFNRK